MIRLENVAWDAPTGRIVSEVSVEFPTNQLTAIVGPNGSGKTTVMHLAAGLRAPSQGQVFLGPDPLNSLSARHRARKLALVEQMPATDLDLSVREVVELGRIPHRGAWPGAKDRDPSAVAEAMEIAAVTHLADRRWQTMSGGERQRVHLARALAQRPEVLLLDEPTNHLDLAHQIDFLERVDTLGVSAIVVLHDLDLAAAYCPWTAVMHKGRLRTFGPTAEVLTADLIREVFEVQVEVRNTDRLRVDWSRP